MPVPAGDFRWGLDILPGEQGSGVDGAWHDVSDSTTEVEVEERHHLAGTFSYHRYLGSPCLLPGS